MSDLTVVHAQEVSPRDQATALEAALLDREDAVTELPVFHHFSPGVYARELHIPAGMVCVGKIHKYAQLNILSCGEILVATEDGPKRFSAPYTVVSPAGTKRAVWAQTDCVWTTIHGTDETDVAAIEEKFIAKDEQEYLAFCATIGEIKCLG